MKKIIQLITYILVFLIIFLNNINNRSFWFDESGQFLIAKGLNHYSNLHNKYGDITEVINNNTKYNLDPGGFSIILHYWSFLSNDPVYLRLLPFLFFLLSSYFIYKIAYKWDKESYFLGFSGLILLVSDVIKQYSFELRPYSMESFSVIFALYIYTYADEILNDWKKTVSFSTILMILMTSRYSSFISVFSLIILILVQLYKNKFNKKLLINYVLFLTPIFIGVLCVYDLTLKYQNPGSESPFYVSSLMLSNNSINNIITENRIKIILPFIFLSLIYFLSFFSKNKLNIINKYKKLITFGFLLNSLFIALSFLGKYPWAIDTRWDISVNTIFVISFIPIIDIIYTSINKKINFIIIAFFIVIILNLSKNFKYGLLDTIYINYIGNSIDLDSKIAANTSSKPSLKYLFEYGDLSDDKYKNIYKNLTYINHSKYSIEDGINSFENLNNFEYIILSHIDYDNSDIKRFIEENHNWVNITKEEPSKIYKNTLIKN